MINIHTACFTLRNHVWVMPSGRHWTFVLLGWFMCFFMRMIITAFQRYGSQLPKQQQQSKSPRCSRSFTFPSNSSLALSFTYARRCTALCVVVYLPRVHSVVLVFIQRLSFYFFCRVHFLNKQEKQRHPQLRPWYWLVFVIRTSHLLLMIKKK